MSAADIPSPHSGDKPAKPTLFGQDGDEVLYDDIDGYLEGWCIDRSAGDHELTLREHAVLPKGDSGANRIWTGAEIVERVVEWFNDDCGFCELGDEYKAAAKLPQVVAAFDRARKELVSHQRFMCAGREIAAHRIIVTIPEDEGYHSWAYVPCGRCGGSGNEYLSFYKRCAECGGIGRSA